MGQPKSAEPTSDNLVNAEHFFDVKEWSASDELPHWNVGGVYQAYNGFTYIKNGPFLLRFNGQKFTILDTIFTSKNAPAFFTEDNKGQIWVLSETQISLIIDNQIHPYSEVYKYPLPRELNSEFVLFSNLSHIYLFHKSHRTLWRFNQGWKQVLELGPPVTGAGNGSPLIIFPESENRWWILHGSEAHLYSEGSTESERRYHITPGSNEKFTFFRGALSKLKADGTIHPLIPNIKISTNHFRSSFTLISPYYTDVLISGDYRFELSVDSTYNLTWQSCLDGTKNLLYRDYYKATYQIKPTIYLDGQAFIYTRSDPASLCLLRVKRKQIRQFIPNHSLRFITLSKNQKLIARIAANNDLLALDLTQDSLSYFRLDGGKRSLPFYSSAQNDTLFLISNNPTTLSYWTKNQKSQVIQKLGVRQFYIRQVLSLPGRKILIAWRHKLTQHSIGDSTQNQTLHSFPEHTEILTLLKDPAGEIWLGTNKGVFHLQSKSFYLQAHKSDSLRVHHIYADPHGFFWLATQKGLLKWRPYTESPAQVVDYELFFDNNQLHAVYPDSSGRLWMSSNNGILVVDTLDYTVARYSEADGLVHHEFNYAAHLQDSQQQLYFGGIGGLSVFNPNEIDFKQDKSHQLSSAILSSLKAITAEESLSQLKRESNQDKQISWQLIPKELRSLQLNFDLANYNNHPVQLAWRIPQVDSNWNTFSIDEGLRFYQLTYGFFDLEIRTASKSLSSLVKQRSYHFYQAYPWYQKPWMLAVLALFLASASYPLIVWQLFKNHKEKAKLEKAIQQHTSDLRKQNRIIQKQNLVLQQADDAKNKLLKNINHEFRTPLSIIQVEAQLLREKSLEKTDLLGHYQNIEEQIHHLGIMLDQVMELGKLETGSLNSHREQVAWPMSMLKLVSQFEGLAHKKHLIYQLDLSPKQRKFLSFDYPRFERIASNLITNALKFTPELGRVTVRISLENQELTFAVEDNGPGIDPAEQKRIFLRYQQGAAAQDPNLTGFGIGLALAKEYARLLEGNIKLESTLGEGSCFTLSIPVNEEEAPAFLLDKRQEDRLDPLSSGSARQDKPHLLVVEDHPQLRKSLNHLFSKHYFISTATHGLKAFKMLQEDPSIELILSDAMMPLLDGFQLLQKVREDPELKAKPFILLTALSDSEDRLNGLRLGVDAYLTKPFNQKELLVRVKNLLNQQQARRRFIQEQQEQAKTHKELQNNDIRHQEPELESFDETWLKELENAVHKLLADPKLKMAFIADQMNISERTLFNKVKAYTGLSPSEYLRKARLNQAKALLQARHYPTVKEVAYAVGFLDTKNFTAIYKKEFGCNPKKDLEAKTPQ